MVANDDADATPALVEPLPEYVALAALRGGIKTVLIPEANAKDLQDIPGNVKNGLEIIPVRWIDKVLELALERQPVPLTEEEIAASDAVLAAAVPVAEVQGSVKH